MCKHFKFYSTFKTEFVKGHKIVTVIPHLELNKAPFHVAIHRLETILTRIVLYPTRNKPEGEKSWFLNNFLNHSRFTPYYMRLKSLIFGSVMVYSNQ